MPKRFASAESIKKTGKISVTAAIMFVSLSCPMYQVSARL